jgi:hypothetical protein
MENTIGLGVGIPLALVAGAVLYLSTTGEVQPPPTTNTLALPASSHVYMQNSPQSGGTRRRKGKKDKRRTRHNARKK